MIHYLIWRAMTGRHDQITLSFMILGHKKFSSKSTMCRQWECGCRTLYKDLPVRLSLIVQLDLSLFLSQSA